MKPSLFSTPKPTTTTLTLTFFLLFLLLLLLTTLFLPKLQAPSPPTPTPFTFSTATATATADSHHSLFLSYSSNATLSSFLRSLTLQPHLSPSPSHLHLFLSFLPSPPHSPRLSSSSFLTLLSYPTSVSLTLSLSSSTSAALTLSEPDLPPSVVPPYHAFSPSSSISSLPVFVNFGRKADYGALSALGVSVHGRIALARRGGGISRGGVVRLAEAEGAAAVLVFREDGERGAAERGTVMAGLGDALTPGWGAKEGAEALGLEDEEVTRRFPGIPSMPVSRECAEAVLREMKGARVPREWREEGLWEAVEGVGPGPVVLNFTYKVMFLAFMFEEL